jgi:uncharacterized protein (DUF1697 family)
MTTYVALLRGINVSGKNKVKMEDLRAIVGSLGCERVQTYIQSGNVVFDSSTRSAAKVSDEISGAITRELALDVTVLVRTAADLTTVLATSPLDRNGVDTTKLHVTFLASTPPAAKLRALADVDASPDALAVVGREVYVHCPNGYGRTKLNNTFFEKRLGVGATTRNWRTVQTLAALANECTDGSGATA